MKRMYLHILSDCVERADNVAAIYRKSLLYFVSNALEGIGEHRCWEWTGYAIKITRAGTVRRAPGKHCVTGVMQRLRQGCWKRSRTNIIDTDN